MPFDSIMGVGRSPQITKDFVINPYSFSQLDIAPNSIVKIDSAAGSTGEIGKPKNVVDSSFTTDDLAYSFSTTDTSGTNKSVFFIFDLGREFFIRDASFNLQVDITNMTLGSTNTSARKEISNDGLTWTSINADMIASIVGTYLYNATYQMRYFKARFLRIEHIYNVTSGYIKVNLFKFVANLDNLQY